MTQYSRLRGTAERILMVAMKHKSPLSYEEKVDQILAELTFMDASVDLDGTKGLQRLLMRRYGHCVAPDEIAAIVDGVLNAVVRNGDTNAPTSCSHTMGERSYAAVEEEQCPICLREDRDRWRTAAENYQREAFNLSAAVHGTGKVPAGA